MNAVLKETADYLFADISLASRYRSHGERHVDSRLDDTPSGRPIPAVHLLQDRKDNTNQRQDQQAWGPGARQKELCAMGDGYRV